MLSQVKAHQEAQWLSKPGGVGGVGAWKKIAVCSMGARRALVRLWALRRCGLQCRKQAALQAHPDCVPQCATAARQRRGVPPEHFSCGVQCRPMCSLTKHPRCRHALTCGTQL